MFIKACNFLLYRFIVYLVVFKHVFQDGIMHLLCLCAFSGESFMENSVAASEHLKRSPRSPNSMVQSAGLRSPSKLLHHNSTGRKKRHRRRVSSYMFWQKFCFTIDWLSCPINLRGWSLADGLELLQLFYWIDMFITMQVQSVDPWIIKERKLSWLRMQSFGFLLIYSYYFG